MSRFILQFGMICWSFVFLFIVFLVFASLIPTSAILYVSTILGALILGLIGYNLRQIHLREGFDFGWFLAVKKGYWQLLVGLFGLGLLVVGLFGLVFPQAGNELGEKHAMKVAYLLAVLFWIALTSTVLSWSLVCFSASVENWRLGKTKSIFQSIGLGSVCLLLATLFFSLFLEVINENFFPLSTTTQNWILGVFAIVSIVAGLLNGKFEDSDKSDD